MIVFFKKKRAFALISDCKYAFTIRFLAYHFQIAIANLQPASTTIQPIIVILSASEEPRRQ